MQVKVYTETEVTVIDQFEIEVTAPEVVAYFDLSPNENWQDHIKEFVDSRLTELTADAKPTHVLNHNRNPIVHEVIYESK